MHIKSPSHFLFLDLETAGFGEHIRLINAYHCERVSRRKSAYAWVQRGHITACALEQFLDGLLAANIQNARVYAHNAGFDIRYLINELRRLKIRHSASTQMNGSVLLSAKIYIPDYNSRGIMLEIRDSMRLAPMSLEAFAKSFCPDYPKLDAPDFDNCETAELIPYCKRDCEILYHGLQTFAAEMGTKLERLPLTVPSLAFAQLRKIGDALHDVKATSGLTRRWNDMLRDYYYGGRIYIAEGTKIDNHYDVVSLDITSSYPAQMCKYDYPMNVAPDYYVNPTSLPKDGRYLAKIRITDYNPALPVLPYRQKSGITYPRGTFITHASDLEIQFVVKNQHDTYRSLEVLELIHWTSDKCRPWLREFVDVNYKVKLKGDEMNKVEAGSGDLYRTIGKLLLNSAYGKFAEKYHDTEDNILYTGHDADAEDYTHVDYASDTEHTADRRNVAIAAMITAAGRVQLAEMINYYGAQNVIYCDTDSVKIIKSVYDTTPQLPLINDELGGWKNEGVYTKFTVIAPKLYYGLHDGKPELKAKGVRVKQGRVNFCTALYANDHKIANTFDAITRALSSGAKVTAMFNAQPTQMRTYLKTGEIAACSMRSFTQPQNVTGFDYDFERGYSFKMVKNGD